MNLFTRIASLALLSLACLPAAAQHANKGHAWEHAPTQHPRAHAPVSRQAWEHASPRAIFHRMDRNGDGRLSQWEVDLYRQQHSGADRFNLDLNGDGRVSAREWQIERMRRHPQGRTPCVPYRTTGQYDRGIQAGMRPCVP